MKKYQIVECGAEFGYAGTKATQDIAEIAEKMGFEPCFLRMRSRKKSKAAKGLRQIGYFADWARVGREIERDSLVLLQHPFHYPQLTRERVLRKLKKRNVRFICMVHDVEEIRGFRYNDYYKREFQFMLEIADVLVVHNEKMMAWFEEKGVPRERLVNLHIFDYIQHNSYIMSPLYERTVMIAGNLDNQKSAYLGELGRLEKSQFELYSGRSAEKLADQPNVKYCGRFPADSPGRHLRRGFGLVWDGSSIDSCQGEAGEYLRYNNPHKLSLFLSCGIPIVIWRGAAEAEFVRSRGMGICVNSLWEMEQVINRLDETAYRRMSQNAWETGRKLLAGEYTKNALIAAQIELQYRDGSDKREA